MRLSDAVSRKQRAVRSSAKWQTACAETRGTACFVKDERPTILSSCWRLLLKSEFKHEYLILSLFDDVLLIH
jgi:hypothetical protein